MQLSELNNRIPKIVSNLSNLFEDPDSVRDTGHALVLLQNPTPSEYRSLEMNSRDTNEWFHGSNRRVLCSIRNLYNYILSFVSKLALVLLLNTNARFHGSNRSIFYNFRNLCLVFPKSYQNLHQCCCRIPMNGSGVVIEVYSADIGTHSLYSKIVSKLALVLLQNTNERFQGSNRSILCNFRNPSPVF